ncbi:MAG TPA: hypothetical protein VEY30_05075 [Myxococcaceae bacterium]|nr:hypothetical protein [Myxococcaceae bacterium]
MKTFSRTLAVGAGAALLVAVPAFAQGETEGRIEREAEQKVEDVKAASKRVVDKDPNSSVEFGTMGQLVISDDFQLDLNYSSRAGDIGRLRLSPALDYFLKSRISIGGFVRFDTTFSEGTDLLDLGLGARVGYTLPVGETIMFWPRVFAAVTRLDPGGSIDGSTTFDVGVDAPFLLPLANHFFIGAGPSLAVNLGDDSGVTVGLQSIVGGYF